MAQRSYSPPKRCIALYHWSFPSSIYIIFRTNTRMVLYYVCKIIEDSWKRIKKIGQSQLIVDSQLKHLILGSMGLYNKEEEGEEVMARRKHEGRQAPFGVPLVHQVSRGQCLTNTKPFF